MAEKKTNQFDLDEVFRQLRTNIEFSQMDDELNTICITSSNQNEGKSTVAVNLARIFSLKYKKILLVDCDLRNPSAHKLLGISNAGGLTNLLKHFREGDSILGYSEIKTRQYKNSENEMYILTTGSRVPNPQEVLSSERFYQFVSQAKEDFDYVIFDCPPIGHVSDAIPVANATDGTLFVVNVKDTDKKDAKTCVSELERNGAHVIGLVLNRVEQVSSKYGYGYYGE